MISVSTWHDPMVITDISRQVISLKTMMQLKCLTIVLKFTCFESVGLISETISDNLRQFLPEIQWQFKPDLIIRLPGLKDNQIHNLLIGLPGGLGGIEVLLCSRAGEQDWDHKGVVYAMQRHLRQHTRPHQAKYMSPKPRRSFLLKQMIKMLLGEGPKHESLLVLYRSAIAWMF